MATIEIDENELAQYKALSGEITKAMANPEARRKVQEALKITDPNRVIPELDAAKPLQEALNKVDERISLLDKKLLEDAAAREAAEKVTALKAKWESGRAELRAEGYTEDGIKKIEELMEKEGIANHKAGAAYFDRLNPPEIPVAPQDSGFDMLTKPFTQGEDEASRKALFENPDQWAAGEVANTLKDLRKR